MNRAQRRAISRQNQRWLRALWASDAPLAAKQLGSDLVANATSDGRVKVADDNGRERVYNLSVPPTSGGDSR